MMSSKLAALFLIIYGFQICVTDAFLEDYTPVGSSYYKYHREVATWTGAKDVCQSEGALLYHPENRNELAQVYRVLQVKEHGYLIHSGFSDRDQLGEYVTVDGRSINQVFNRWEPEQPKSGENNENRCGRLSVNLYLFLYVYPCEDTRRYICKFNPTTVNMVNMGMQYVKTITSTASDTLARMFERQLENQTAAFKVFERKAEVMQTEAANQTAVLQQLVLNQTAILKRQAMALERFASAFPAYTAALQMLLTRGDSNDLDVRF